MKTFVNVIRWIGVAIFGIMANYALFQKGFLGALLFVLGGALIAPLDVVKKLRQKFKIKKALSIVLAIVFLFGGVLATPTAEVPVDTNSDTNISQTVSDNPSEDNSSVNSSNNSSDKNTDVASPVGSEHSQTVDLSNIPAYSGTAFVKVNNNIPNFSSAELKTIGYETYSSLDSLGRTRMALACVGKDTMPKPNEERGSISNIKPSGWNQAKYDNVSGGWLYNRCHLIGWQLSAENDNKKNLITGTKYLNVNGMLPFENMVADYIKETGNHVAYRITPIYDGNNLLASGVQMEAYSVEDKGDGICFNVYCYNVQPGIKINYSNGSSSGSNSSKEETVSKPTTTVKPETPSTDNNQQETNSKTVYITETGKKYHSTKNCSGLSNAKKIYESTLQNAKNKGLGPCAKCY